MTRKDRNELRQLIREILVEQLNKSSFKAGYKPVEKESNDGRTTLK